MGDYPIGKSYLPRFLSSTISITIAFVDWLFCFQSEIEMLSVKRKK